MASDGPARERERDLAEQEKKDAGDAIRGARRPRREPVSSAGRRARSPNGRSLALPLASLRFRDQDLYRVAPDAPAIYSASRYDIGRPLKVAWNCQANSLMLFGAEAIRS
jgi:hypothetical protein